MATHSSILAWRIPMDRGAWRTAVQGVTKSQTRLTTERLSTAQQNFWFLEEPPTKEEGTTFLRLTTAPNTVISILFFLPQVLFFFWKSLIFKKNYYFLAVLGLHCCTGFSLVATSRGGGYSLGCGGWASHCSGFSCCRVWALGLQ